MSNESKKPNTSPAGAHADTVSADAENRVALSSSESGVAQADVVVNRFAVKRITEVNVGDSFDGQNDDAYTPANLTNTVIPQMPVEEQKKLFDSLQTALSVGKNTLSQNVVAQTFTVDESWIDSVENGLFSIEQIVRNPASSIIEERDVVSVEKAKRIDGVSVRHLSNHTQYIKDILPDGSIRPSKVMTRALEQDMAIYENRFVYALVKRLTTFVEEKYQLVKELSKIKDNTVMKAASEFDFGSANIEINLSVSVKTPSGNKKSSELNLNALQRLETIRQHLKIIEGTDFARIMRNAKPVLPPIMKTNMLSINVDYRKCYELWVLMSSFDSGENTVAIKEKSLPFDSDYFDDIASVMTESVAVMMKNNSLREALYSGIGFTTRRKKRFKVVKKVDFNVKQLSGKAPSLDENIEKYYVERIKKASSDISALSSAFDTEESMGVDVNFRRFYKGLQKINNEMFIDLLGVGAKPDLSKKKNPVEKARAMVAYQKELLRKYRFLNQLKADEIRLSELKLATQEQRLKKLQEDFEKKTKAYEQQLKLQAERKQKEKERKLRQKEKAKALAKKKRIATAAKKAKEAAKKAAAKKSKKTTTGTKDTNANK